MWPGSEQGAGDTAGTQAGRNPHSCRDNSDTDIYNKAGGGRCLVRTQKGRASLRREHLSWDLMEVRTQPYGHGGGRAFPAEGTACAKVLGWKQARPFEEQLGGQCGWSRVMKGEGGSGGGDVSREMGSGGGWWSQGGM